MIDILALDEQASTIWVCEVKDPAETFGHAAIRNMVNDFDGPAGKRYVEKLLAKVADVSADPASVADRLGETHAQGSWNVRPLMVTRRPVAAAFATDNRVPFAAVDQLVRTIRTLSTDARRVGAPSGDAT